VSEIWGREEGEERSEEVWVKGRLVSWGMGVRDMVSGGWERGDYRRFLGLY
jgi:hypothetical protein